jgi:hypothetical protein
MARKILLAGGDQFLLGLRGVFLRERRYANLGHLLPMFPIERAVKPGVSALPLRLASHS